MRATLPITIASSGEEKTVITAHEMTVAEVRAWVTESSAQPWRDPILALSLVGQECESIGLDELARMCDYSAEELEPFAPSELAPLAEAAKKLNPLFFQLRAALAQAVRQQTSAPHSETLTETSAPSFDLATPTF